MDKEDALFMKALKFLYERRLAQIGFEANVVITKIEEPKAE